jgi:hypothetical protein
VRLAWRLAVPIAATAGLAGLYGRLEPAPESAPATASAPVSQPGTSTRRQPTEALDLVPAESLLCWYARPFPDMLPPSEDPAGFDRVLQWGSLLARPALNAEARLWARAVEMFSLAIRFPHLLVLIDAQAVQDPDRPEIVRGDRIRAALIVETRGQNEPFARILQSAINELTDQQKATVARKEAAHWPYLELRDQRLPDWAAIAWGTIDGYFVLAIGPDVWQDIAAVAAGQAPALSQAGWLEAARGLRGKKALIEIIVASKQIRQRLDPMVENRATGFFRAWQAENIDWSHWALGFEGRALYCVAHFLENGQTRQHIYADPGIRDERLLQTIPDTARYAIYRIEPERVIPSFFNSLLATCSERERRNILRLWQHIQRELGFDAERDILANLGQHIIMHNDPPHPLRIPLAMTTLTEIRTHPEQVRRTIDIICNAWRDALARHPAPEESPSLVINRDSDGIWYLQFGIFAGPAWTVTDRFVITSWSPAALRSYLEKVGERAGKLLPPAETQPSATQP